MGFGFNFMFILVIVPATFVLFLLWVGTGRRSFGWALGLIWAAVIALVVFSLSTQAYFAKVELKKADYYGTYVVHREMFAGEQADWQYNTYRFDVTAEDSIHFHVTRGPRILRTYHGTISTVMPFSSDRLVLHMGTSSHHILEEQPTIYRDSNGFYLVFHSRYYNNVFFQKGTWKPINE